MRGSGWTIKKRVEENGFFRRGDDWKREAETQGGRKREKDSERERKKKNKRERKRMREKERF